MCLHVLILTEAIDRYRITDNGSDFKYLPAVNVITGSSAMVLRKCGSFFCHPQVSHRMVNEA